MENSLKQRLKQEAKEHKNTMGVLAVKNTINGRVYIQGAINLEALVNKIKFLLKLGQFSNVEVQKDWNENGEQAFVFEHIVVTEPKENRYTNYREEVSKAEKAAKEAYGATAALY